MQKTYPIVDLPKRELRKKFGFEGLGVRTPKREIRAVRTGEMRSPKKGEWYLSGAVPAGYIAKNDLGMSFNILKLVLVEKTVVETLTILDEEDSVPEAKERRYYIDGAVVTVPERKMELPHKIINRADFIYCFTEHKIVKSRVGDFEVDEGKLLDEGVPSKIVWDQDNWTPYITMIED